ncbi:MAG: thiamine phosphate synthase [Terrimicrobiaceae bacterium]
MNWDDCLLYGILDMGYVGEGDVERVTAELLRGGVDIFQLRAKGWNQSGLKPLAEVCVKRCRDAGVPLIVNDHAELAGEVGADGVHVGQDDISVSEARRLSGGLLVGQSTHSLAQVAAAMEEGADYIGFGPLFATPTKPDYQPVGLNWVREAEAASQVPVFCIGGIKRGNLREVVAAGARRVVIVSGLLLAADIAAECRACREVLSRL